MLSEWVFFNKNYPQYGTIPDHANFSPSTTGLFTIEALVRVQEWDASNWRSIVSKGGGGGGSNYEWMLYSHSTGTPGFGIVFWQSGGATHIGANHLGSGLYNLNQWYWISAVYSSGNYARLFVDGVQVDEQTSFTGSSVNGDALLRIAGRADGSLYNHMDLAELRIWNTARTPSEVATYAEEDAVSSGASGLVGLWKVDEGSGTTLNDSTVNAQHATLVNDPVWSAILLWSPSIRSTQVRSGFGNRRYGSESYGSRPPQGFIAPPYVWTPAHTVGPRRAVDYTVVVNDLDETPLAEFPVKNLQYSFVLNSPGSCNFTVPLHHSKSTREVIWPKKRTVHVFREGVKVWGGYVWTVDARSNEGTVRLGCEGYMSIFKRRYIDVDVTYTDWDVFNVVRALVDFTQSKPNGDAGIVHGNLNSAGVLVTREYKADQRTNILAEFKKFTCISGGIDMEVTPDKVLRLYYPHKGSDITNYKFELGKNIDSYYFPVDTTNLTNEMTGIGATPTNGTTLTKVLTDVASQLEYGLLQDVFSARSEKDQDTLDRRTEEAFRNQKVPRQTLQIQVFGDDPSLYQYFTGDHIPVDIQDGWAYMVGNKRIIAVTVSLANSGREAIGVSFDEELEVGE